MPSYDKYRPFTQRLTTVSRTFGSSSYFSLSRVCNLFVFFFWFFILKTFLWTKSTSQIEENETKRTHCALKLLSNFGTVCDFSSCVIVPKGFTHQRQTAKWIHTHTSRRCWWMIRCAYIEHAYFIINLIYLFKCFACTQNSFLSLSLFGFRFFSHSPMQVCVCVFNLKRRQQREESVEM